MAFTSLGVYSLLLVLLFFVVLVLQLSFLAGRQRMVDSATFIFRILVKEHHIPMLSWQSLRSRFHYRLILAFTLIYNFLLTILIETTIGTNLVGLF